MKKITTITAIAFLAVSVFSCSKTSSGLINQQAAGHAAASAASIEVNVVSKWISPTSFSVETDRLGKLFIKGLYPFTASTQISYDESSHIELAYIRITTGQRPPYVYKRLPSNINVVTNGLAADIVMDYSLEPGGLNLFFKDADYAFLSRAAGQTASGIWNFRYIVIPKAKYQSMNIDWNNLSVVASALGFSL